MHARLRHARQPNPLGQHGRRRALDAHRRRRPAAATRGTAAATASRTSYDVLGRRAEVAAAGPVDGAELLIGRGPSTARARRTPRRTTCAASAYQAFDGAGVLTTDDYDFKGNPLSIRRQFAVDYRTTLDWSSPVRAGTGGRFVDPDELRRAQPAGDVRSTPGRQHHPPHVQRDSGLLDGRRREPARRRQRSTVRHPGAVRDRTSTTTPRASATRIVLRQRRRSPPTHYDPLTFRLVRPADRARAASRLQDLSYTYDPVGNITHIEDDAQQTHLLPQPARRAEQRLPLRRRLPADRGDRPRAPRPGERPADGTDHSGRSSTRCTPACTTPATATRWAATLERYALRRRRQLLETAARRQRPGAPRLDPHLLLRRTEPARTSGGEQPAQLDAGRRPAPVEPLQLRRARQHDGRCRTCR